MSTPKGRKFTRRDFLKRVGAGGTLATAHFLLGSAQAPVFAEASPGAIGWGVLADLTRCTGCNSCALACKESNGLPLPDVVPDALGPDVYTFVEHHPVTTTDGALETHYVKRQCMHCLDAACVAACPAAAMYKSPEGPVIYRSYRCLGCRYCQAACPFSVPRFDWDDGVDPVISKCWLCHDRLQEGQKPACVEACPNGALHFGQREHLLAQARARISSNPGRYVDHVFGEFEVGGTLMLYLSDVPFEQLGFPVDLPQTAPPEETEKIISKLPYVLGGMTLLMTGTAVYTHRKPSTGDQEGPSNHHELQTHASDKQEE